MARHLSTFLWLVAAAFMTGCSDGNDGDGGQGTDDLPLVSADGSLQANVRRTTGGVPHVRAENLSSLAFGAGHVQAMDNVCLIAESIIKARGERSLFFGPGENNANIVSDFSYRVIAQPAGASGSVALTPEGEALLDGFVAGYNHYLAQTPSSDLPPACRDQPWVRDITREDLLAYHAIVARYASGDLFASGAVFAAVPPGTSVEPTPVSVEDDTSGAAETGRDSAAFSFDDYLNTKAFTEPSELMDTGLASNAWGIGSELSSSERGALLANPHFPYTGPRRLYQMHLSIPGHYDVNGATLTGVPLPLIGFNDAVAWSHTVSTGRRFTWYELRLAEGDDMAYVKDGETIALSTQTIRIEVANGSDSPTVLEREFHFSEYGPMIAADLVSGGRLPGWGANGTAYTYRDANADVGAMLNSWLDMGRSRSLEDFQAVFQECGSSLWTNTVYADEAGNAFYIDSSSVPHLSAEALAVIETKRSASADYALLFDNGIPLLDGSTSRDDWVEGDCGALVPYADRPHLVRRDFV